MISLSFKRTRPVDVQSALYEHIRHSHQETHPEAFKWDAEEWQRQRNAYERVVNGTELRISTIDTISHYYAQLSFIVTKLPHDIGLQFHYDPANNERKSVVLSNLALERYCVLYNLGVAYNQLANMESRSDAKSVRQASQLYSIASGTFDVLRKIALQPLLSSLEDNTLKLPPEFDADYLSGLEDLMLAQAQEAAWQLPTVSDTKYGDAALARISKTVASLYSSALSKLRMPSTWPDFLPSVELQALHFSAVSQYRKSEDDHNNHRFGEQITRLDIALRIAKKAVQHAKSYQLTYTTGRNFIATLEDNLTRSKNDNDYIYNQNPPSESRLPDIQEFPMVKPIVTDVLGDSQKVLKGQRVILAELLPWGACVAFDLYDDRKENWIREEIAEPLKALELMVTRTLTELGLPASLDALNKPTGLPPSMHRKAEEVRLGDGPDGLRGMSENVQTLYTHDTSLLDEALDFLDQEVSEDEAFRANHPITAGRYLREFPASPEANQHLISKAQTYRETLERAAGSDEVVRNKIDDHEDDMFLLSLPQEDLESVVPNSTGGAANSKSTLTQAREIRALLEQLADIQQNALSILSRVDHLSRTDNRPRLTRFATGLDMWAEVEPLTFEPIVQEELGKYNSYKDEAVDLENLVNEVLNKVKDKNERFLNSRKDDPSVKARERMLQKLDVAYNMYRELLGNLEEGLKFYNDLGVYLNAYKEECKEWVYERRHTARSLVGDMQSLSLNDSEPNLPNRMEDSEPVLTQSEFEKSPELVPRDETTPTPDGSQLRSKGKAIPSGLPPPPGLYSGGWESIQLPQPPREEPTTNPSSRRSASKSKVPTHAY